MSPIARASASSRSGCSAHSENDAGAASVATPRTRSSSAARMIDSDPPVLDPASHTPPTSLRSDITVTAWLRSDSQPSSEKSPSEAPVPRKLKVRTAQPVSRARRSASSGYVDAELSPPRGPVGNPWHSTSPGTRFDDQSRAALDGKTVLALDPLMGQEVLVLALRAHRLVDPVTVPAADLAGLVADPADGPASEPALSEAAFQARYNGVTGAL